ncbi:MAG: hypothetical protein WBE48_19460 [Xanthobacteraceae bacterium]|jgi:ElaB/YqjD/DUF883 family membrane-anchored ribosome-binding protein
MSSASTASQNVRDAANDTVRDARESVRDAGKAAADASGDIQDDLQALRDDFSRLAEQVREILTTRGNAAWQRAKSSIDDVVSEARDSGRDAAGAAAGAMRDASDNFVEAVDESLKSRPYTTLAIVAGLGFLFGLAWRR